MIIQSTQKKANAPFDVFLPHCRLLHIIFVHISNYGQIASTKKKRLDVLGPDMITIANGV